MNLTKLRPLFFDFWSDLSLIIMSYMEQEIQNSL